MGKTLTMNSKIKHKIRVFVLQNYLKLGARFDRVFLLVDVNDNVYGRKVLWWDRVSIKHRGSHWVWFMGLHWRGKNVFVQVRENNYWEKSSPDALPHIEFKTVNLVGSKSQP